MRLFSKKTGFLCITGMLLSLSGYSAPQIEQKAAASGSEAAAIGKPKPRFTTTSTMNPVTKNTRTVVKNADGHVVAVDIEGKNGMTKVSAITASLGLWHVEGSLLKGSLKAEKDGSFIYTPEGLLSKPVSFHFVGDRIVIIGKVDPKIEENLADVVREFGDVGGSWICPPCL